MDQPRKVTEHTFRSEIFEAFKALDMDQNNVLDWEECKGFVAAVMKPLGGYDANSFKETYDLMDKNDDGLISKEELIERVVEVGRAKGLFINELAEEAPWQPDGKEMQQEEDAELQRTSPRSAKPEVDKEIFKAGLGCLGKTFNNARHAYLKLNIQSKSLDTINVSYEC